MVDETALVLQSVTRQIQYLKTQLLDPNLQIANGRSLMGLLGALGVGASQKAFREQALGKQRWPARYEGQESPKFNFAGALQDWKSGRTNPKPNRFQDRPALIDEGIRGGLLGSLTSKVTGPLEVTWGSPKPYAELQNKGGYVSISYDAATRTRIVNWLLTNPGKGERAAKFRTAKVSGTKNSRIDYANHISTLLARNPWTQRVAPRPFLGVTAELGQDMIQAVKDYFVKVQRGSP